MRNVSGILNKLPESISSELRKLPIEIMNGLEEIRIKAGQEVRILSQNTEYIIGHATDENMIGNILNNMLNHSYYAYEEELAKGYVTIEGGHRVGVCGRTVIENGKVKLIKDISSLNIRCGREIHGISKECLRYIVKGNQEIFNTLIVSPPKCGKTTLLRDIIRSLSYEGFKIGVCDERSEIAGMYLGKPSYDVGPRTDVLDGCPKETGMIMLIRSMGPDIIATDEIGKKEDIYAIEAALCAGIGIITTIHGNTYEDIVSSGIGEAVLNRAFQKMIFLSNDPKTGSIKEIHNV